MTKPDSELALYLSGTEPLLLGKLRSISRSGLSFVAVAELDLSPGDRLRELSLRTGAHGYALAGARVIRGTQEGAERVIALAFDVEQDALLRALAHALREQDYVTGELKQRVDGEQPAAVDAAELTLDSFYSKRGKDLLAKCQSFRPWIEDMQRKQLYQRMYRVTLTGPLDHRVTVFDPIQRRERSMICFDSNSYLGLHRHPRVVARVQQVLAHVGYGTGSAQLLCGTNRYLRELEDELSDFLGREDTVVFPTGYAANMGTVHALVRKHDAVLRDRLAHASLIDGARTSPAKFNQVFEHNDMRHLEQLLVEAEQQGCDGKLVVTDGVYSMHGRLCPLPDMLRLCREHGARLMIDDAHGLGVLGATGRGIEEHFGVDGQVDVLMGTLSKALGAVGGFVSGSRDLVYYLRFFASIGMFTTALPAATCAGVAEAVRVMRSEPEHREQLWSNIRYFIPALREAGFIVPDPDSPITTLYMGMHPLMLEFSRELFEAGIKCGSVMFPAVARGESILRLTLNARHTREDLDEALDILTALGRKWGILHRSREEIRELGARVKLGSGVSGLAEGAPALQA